jgi:hypothetical protein
MPRRHKLVLGHAVTAPPARDGPDGIASAPRGDPEDSRAPGSSPKGLQRDSVGALRWTS